MTSVDSDLRSGRRLETGRRSESIIYIYIYFQYNTDSNAGIQLYVDLHLS